MALAPHPVVSLYDVVLEPKLNILPALFHEIAPIGPFFALIPALAVPLVSINDPRLYIVSLSLGSGQRRIRAT
jgi:hypothetical protein